MSRRSQLQTLGIVLAAGCGQADDQRIGVEDNPAGIVALQTQHYDEATTRVFELRGFDASGDTVGVVRQRVGVIADLPQYLPGNDTGAEMIVTTGARASRVVTHDTARFHLDVSDPGGHQFLAIPEVVSTLRAEANIIVGGEPSAAPSEQDYAAGTCQAGYVLTTPTALQCCWYNNAPVQSATVFARADNAVIYRYRNPYINGCRASDGTSSCSGSACYYGPFGYSRPSLDIEGGYPRVERVNGAANAYCVATFYGSPQQTMFGDVTGTLATGQGCPGGDSGAGEWDY